LGERPKKKNFANKILILIMFAIYLLRLTYQFHDVFSGHFILSDDTQVLQLSLIANLHTYVHYFTLHDVHARGFVRPMCLAYVTKDKRKLQEKFPDLRNEFLKVLSSLLIT
jgi:hypothetical protein